MARTGPAAGRSGPPMVRRANLRAVLEAVMAQSPLTASDIMARTGLSRASAHAVCDELINRRLVRELAPTPPSAAGGMGRPSRTYAFHSRAGVVVGIDLSPRTVRAILFDLRGETITGASRTGPEMRHADVVAEEASALVDGLVEEAGVAPETVLAVGVGVPAPVGHTGRILRPNVALPGIESVDLGGALGRRHGWPVLVENDANLAILGERWVGAARGCDFAIMVLAGERLGAGIVEHGRLMRGWAGTAGEMDFLDLVEGVGDTRGIGNIARQLGDLAAFNRPGLARLGDDIPGAALARLAGDAEHVTAQVVLAAAGLGDPAAQRIVDIIAERLARVVAVLSTLLNPELVVIGGAVAEAGESLVHPIRERLPGLTRAPTGLVASQLGERVVATGAARLALDHALEGLLA